MPLDASLTMSPGVGLTNPLIPFFGSAQGFWFDFTTGATGSGIASVSSMPPGTATASQGVGSKQPNWTHATRDYALFDGLDDNLLSTLNPTTSVTLGFCGRITAGAATQIIMGSQLASSGRIRISLNASNVFCAAVGANIEANISSGVAVGGTDFVGLLVVNGSTTELWVNGALKASVALNGAPNTTVPLAIGSNNTAGTISGAAGGRIYRIAAIDREIDAAQKLPFQRKLGAGVVSF